MQEVFGEFRVAHVEGDEVLLLDVFVEGDRIDPLLFLEVPLGEVLERPRLPHWLDGIAMVEDQSLQLLAAAFDFFGGWRPILSGSMPAGRG